MSAQLQPAVRAELVLRVRSFLFDELLQDGNISVQHYGPNQPYAAVTDRVFKKFLLAACTMCPFTDAIPGVICPFRFPWAVYTAAELAQDLNVALNQRQLDAFHDCLNNDRIRYIILVLSYHIEQHAAGHCTLFIFDKRDHKRYLIDAGGHMEGISHLMSNIVVAGIPGIPMFNPEPAANCLWPTYNQTLQTRFEQWNHAHHVIRNGMCSPLLLIMFTTAARFNMMPYMKTVADIIWQAMNTNARKTNFLQRMVRWYMHIRNSHAQEVRRIFHTPGLYLAGGEHRPRCSALKVDGTRLCSRYSCIIPNTNHYGSMCWQHRYYAFNRGAASMRCNQAQTIQQGGADNRN